MTKKDYITQVMDAVITDCDQLSKEDYRDALLELSDDLKVMAEAASDELEDEPD